MSGFKPVINGDFFDADGIRIKTKPTVDLYPTVDATKENWKEHHSVVDRAVRNSLPPLDDVGDDVSVMLDEKDPALYELMEKLVEMEDKEADTVRVCHPIDEYRGRGPITATQILQRAAQIVGGDRAAQHGPKERNHQNIADHWNAYLGKRLNSPITAKDVALMQAELKIARTKLGEHNPDDYVDGAGYFGVAGEIAANGTEL